MKKSVDHSCKTSNVSFRNRKIECRLIDVILKNSYITDLTFASGNYKSNSHRVQEPQVLGCHKTMCVK